MSVSAGTGDRALDTADAELAEANFKAIADQVLSLLDTRRTQVSTVMEHYVATGVSDLYQSTDLAWIKKGDNTKQTILLLLKCLGEIRGHGEDANSKAGKCVAAM